MGPKAQPRKDRFLSRFRREEKGIASIESLFWIPIFVFFLVMVLDVSLLFYGKALALRAVQDGNRALSVSTVGTADATEDYVEALLADLAPNAAVTTSINASTGVVTTAAATGPTEDQISRIAL